MLWMGVGGRTPAHLTPEEDRGDALSKRRYRGGHGAAPQSTTLSASWRILTPRCWRRTPSTNVCGRRCGLGLEYPILPFDLEDKKESVAVYNGELLAYAKGKRGSVTGAGAAGEGAARVLQNG